MRFTVSRKIIAAFSAIVLVGFLGMSIVYVGLIQIKERFREVAEIKEPLSAAAYEMEINVVGGALGVLKYLDTGSDDARLRVEKDEADFHRFRAQYQRLADTPQLRELGVKLDTLYGQFITLGKNLMQTRDQMHGLTPRIAGHLSAIDDILDREIAIKSSQDVIAHKMQAVQKLANNNAQVGIWLGSYLATHKTEYRQRVFDYIGDSPRQLDMLRKVSATRQEKQWLAQLEKRTDLATSDIRQAIALSEQNQQGINKFIDLRVAMDDILDHEIQQLVGQELALTKQITQQISTRIVITIGILSPLFLISAIFVVALLVHRIKRPLVQLTEGADAIGGGDLDYRLTITGNDEFSELGNHFNQMVGQLQATTVSKQLLEIKSDQLEENAVELEHTINELHQEIDRRQQVEAALVNEKERIQVTLRSIGDAVIITDTLGNIEFLNPIAEALTGWGNAEAQGLPLIQVFNIVNEQTRNVVANPVEMVMNSGIIVGLANHTILIHRDGREFAVEDSAAPIRDASGEIFGVVLVFHDVSEKRAMSQRVLWQAQHDTLTGLINRAEFERILAIALNSARSQNNQHALLYLDLDQFKVVNDTCGHGAGDQLLSQLTALLQNEMRETDTLARLGGDEFCVLLERCPIEHASQIADQLRQTVQNFHFVWKGKTFNIGVSIGLVPITDHSHNVEGLLSAADAACYMAKEKGRNRVWIHHAEDSEMALRHTEMEWVARITRALEESQFCLYFQTIAPIAPTQTEGDHYEILLRHIGDSGELVAPMMFIPAAERYGLMPNTDRWVISATLAHCAQLYQTGSGRVLHTCAINLSGASLNDESLLGFIREQLTKYQVSPNVICFEITETVAIANLTKVRMFIHALKAIGCRFSLDDFGSGMSSFAYLKNLPVDYLKIDGSFVKDMAHDPIDHAMVEAINNIGHVMGIKTIAEFVENSEILARLRILGVDYVQGYEIAMPSLFKKFENKPE